MLQAMANRQHFVSKASAARQKSARKSTWSSVFTSHELHGSDHWLVMMRSRMHARSRQRISRVIRRPPLPNAAVNDIAVCFHAQMRPRYLVRVHTFDVPIADRTCVGDVERHRDYRRGWRPCLGAAALTEGVAEVRRGSV
jgi:hypothetical protein